MYIYKITNTVNGKFYIGKTIKDPSQRFRQHFANARRGMRSRLYSAMRKYDRSVFCLEVVSRHNSIEELNEAEKNLIRETRARNNRIGYNIMNGGDGGSCPPEVMARISKLRRSQTFKDKHRVTFEKMSKAVKCIETGMVYYSLHEAARQLGFSVARLSARTSRGRNIFGLHFIYVERGTQSEPTGFVWTKEWADARLRQSRQNAANNPEYKQRRVEGLRSVSKQISTSVAELWNNLDYIEAQMTSRSAPEYRENLRQKAFERASKQRTEKEAHAAATSDRPDVYLCDKITHIKKPSDPLVVQTKHNYSWSCNGCAYEFQQTIYYLKARAIPKGCWGCKRCAAKSTFENRRDKLKRTFDIQDMVKKYQNNEKIDFEIKSVVNNSFHKSILSCTCKTCGFQFEMKGNELQRSLSKNQFPCRQCFYTYRKTDAEHLRKRSEQSKTIMNSEEMRRSKSELMKRLHKEQPSLRHARTEKRLSNLENRRVLEYLRNRKHDFKTDEVIDGQSWDFTIYKDHILKLVVKIGEQTPASPPAGVKMLATKASDWYKLCTEISTEMGVPYREWEEGMFQTCREMTFPYPNYGEERLLRDWNTLCNKPISNAEKDTCGISLVLQHHRSIYSSRKNGKMSPVEAWGDEEKLRRCIRNRFIYQPTAEIRPYHIARGFEKNAIAPRVSVFQPLRARELLMEFAPEVETCVDPFSGFSGRMLGVCSLGIRYEGSDIRPDTVAESNRLIKFLGLDAAVNVSDIRLATPSTTYDVLFTCPPYGNVEQWDGVDQYLKNSDAYIDLCLQKYNARKYIFVVDKTEKYERYVCRKMKNESHINRTNEELVIVIER